MKKAVITLAISSLLAATIALPGYSEENNSYKHFPPHQWNGQGKFEPGKFPPPDMHQRGHELREKLNLTEEQSAKAKELREQSRAKIRPIFEQLKTEKQKLVEMHQSNTSTEDIKKQQEKIRQLKAQIKEIRKENIANFEQILTSDQKAKFKQMRKEGRERMKAMKKHRPKNWEDRDPADKK